MSHEKRSSEGTEKLRMVQECHVVGRGLAEADAGIEDDPVPRNARRFGLGEAFFKIRIHFRRQVPVTRIVLHRLGSSADVHEHQRNAELSYGGGEIWVETESGDVVHQIGSCGDTGPHHGRLRGIHGEHRLGEMFPNRSQGGNEASRLFLFGDRDRSRSGGLGTEIEDVRSLLGHGESPGDAGGTAHAALGEKRILREVEDSHDQGSPSQTQLPSPGQRKRPLPDRSARESAPEPLSPCPRLRVRNGSKACRNSFKLFRRAEEERFPGISLRPPAGPCRTDPRCGGLSGENVPNGLRRPEEMEGKNILH